MSEEKTINQIIKISKIIEGKRHQALLELGISAQLYALIYTIEKLQKNKEETYITAVAKDLGLKSASISRLAERAEKQGILNRELTHSKMKPLSLTLKGEKILKQANKQLLLIHKEVSKAISLERKNSKITFSDKKNYLH